MHRTSVRTVAIIGGGATGVATFIALVRNRAARKIILIDPYVAGQGLAYANTDLELLCNTSVDLMSVLPVETNDLLHYLHENGHEHLGAYDFIPRRQIGDYVRQRFADYLVMAQAHGVEVRQVHDQASRIVRTEKMGYLIETKGGTQIPATEVIVCTGYTRPNVPESIAPYSADPSVCLSPYPENHLKQKMTPYKRILVLGSKLSAVDAALVLCRDKHQVTMASPSGKLAAVRTSLMRSPDELARFAKSGAKSIDYHAPGYQQKLSQLVKSTIAMMSSLPLSEQLAIEDDAISLLRKEIQLAETGKTHWQYALIALSDALNTVVKPQDRLLLKHVKQGNKGWLSRYVGAIPLQNARKLLRYIDEKYLTLFAGELAAVERNGTEWRVKWRSGETLTFDAIVCATGQQLPLFDANSSSISFVSDPQQPVLSPELSSDLMVKLPGGEKNERIWMVGIASHVSVASVNAFFIGVQQANDVAQQIAQLDDRDDWEEEENRPALHDFRWQTRVAPTYHASLSTSTSR